MTIEHRDYKDKILMLLKSKRMTSRQISDELGISVSYTTLLLRKLMKFEGQQVESEFGTSPCGKYTIAYYKLYKKPVGVRRILPEKDPNLIANHKKALRLGHEEREKALKRQRIGVGISEVYSIG